MVKHHSDKRRGADRGQAFSKIIFFRDKELIREFKKGQFELSAQASAVAVREGVGKAGSYTNGIAISSLPKGGLMAEASIGGQRITFEPFWNKKAQGALRKIKIFAFSRSFRNQL